jgi:hypothetical protein
MTARRIGMTEMLDALRLDLHSEAPLPWWMRVHEKARDTHRAIDMQLMLATGDDLEAFKERKRSCSQR